MKELIVFNLKRKLLNVTTVITNVLLFVAIYILFHLDINLPNKVIYLDESMNSYFDYYMDIDSEIIYTDFEIDNSARLYYDGQFRLATDNKINKDQLNQINKDLNRVLCQKMVIEHDINDYQLNNEVIVQLNDEKSFNYAFVILSISFMILMSGVSGVVSDIVYEKSNHIADLLLTNVSANSHLFSKIFSFYLFWFLEIGLTVCFLFINYKMVDLKGVIEIIKAFIAGLDYSIYEVAAIAFISIISLVFIQLLAILFISKFSNVNQINNYQLLMYLLMFMIYLIVYILIDKGLLENQFIKLISLLPGSSMFLMPCRILVKNTNMLEIIITIIFNILAIVALIDNCMNKYKQNLLNSI